MYVIKINHNCYINGSNNICDSIYNARFFETSGEAESAVNTYITGTYIIREATIVKVEIKEVEYGTSFRFKRSWTLDKS